MTLSERFRTRPFAIAAAIALFAAGGVAGASLTRAWQPPRVMAPGAPVAIGSLKAMTQPAYGMRMATVRGLVSEIYGSRFVLADKSGRVLVETGGRAGAAALVAPEQMVTVQGRYASGTLRAAYLIGADGSVTALRGGRGEGRRHR